MPLDSGGGSSITIRVAVGDTIGAVRVMTIGLLAIAADDRILIVVADVEPKVSRIDVAVAEDEKGTEDWLGEKVEDTIEDGLGVRGNDVAALTDTPGDGIEDPENKGEGTAHEEGTACLRAKARGVDAGLESKMVNDVEERDAAEGEVTPLVAADDESTNKTSDNHHPVNEDDE